MLLLFLLPACFLLYTLDALCLLLLLLAASSSISLLEHLNYNDNPLCVIPAATLVSTMFLRFWLRTIYKQRNKSLPSLKQRVPRIWLNRFPQRHWWLLAQHQHCHRQQQPRNTTPMNYFPRWHKIVSPHHHFHSPFWMVIRVSTGLASALPTMSTSNSVKNQRNLLVLRTSQPLSLSLTHWYASAWGGSLSALIALSLGLPQSNSSLYSFSL